ncbi:MAG: PspC domain-containing protein, partial [Actinomycetota bacterium]|nr:PspC domain-containing protein [Actinomycetota bacterium]
MSDQETPNATPEPGPEREAPEPGPDRGPVPRRLFRSRDDRVVGGVAGGLGKYFDVDPVFFRVGFVATAFLGGLGVFLYLAALLFVPAEPSPGEEPGRRSRALTIAAAAVLIVVGGIILSDGGWWFGGSFFGPLGFLLVGGAVVWWLVWGRSRTAASPR